LAGLQEHNWRKIISWHDHGRQNSKARRLFLPSTVTTAVSTVTAAASSTSVTTRDGSSSTLGGDLGSDLRGVGGSSGGKVGSAISLGLGLVQVRDGSSQLVGSLLGTQLGHLQN
jgi:hypothetical protein